PAVQATTLRPHCIDAVIAPHLSPGWSRLAKVEISYLVLDTLLCDSHRLSGKKAAPVETVIGRIDYNYFQRAGLSSFAYDDDVLATIRTCWVYCFAIDDTYQGNPNDCRRGRFNSSLTHADRLVKDGQRSFGLAPIFCVVNNLLSKLKTRLANAQRSNETKRALGDGSPFRSIAMALVAISPYKDRIHDITLVAIDGGFSNVYRGIHPKYGDVALKQLRPGPDHDAHFDLEVGAWQRLVHPGILPFLGIHRQSGFVYMVSPWMENGKALPYLDLHPEVNRVSFLVEVAEALAYIHSQKMVHGDIKANNILVSKEKSAFICDFGLSRPSSTATHAGLKGNGTTLYQAPELFRGASKSWKSDVYAFGITIYEAWFLEILHARKWELPSNAQGAMITDITNGARPQQTLETSSSGQPYDAIWELAETCWAEDPDVRPTMEQVLHNLRAIDSSLISF
ncbi:hypothetical protein FRB99_008754, partial [Tulasnella sp. 403]